MRDIHCFPSLEGDQASLHLTSDRGQRAVNERELAMLRAVMASLKRQRPDYCRAIGEENVAALVIRLYLQGITDESRLREILGVPLTVSRVDLSASAFGESPPRH